MPLRLVLDTNVWLDWLVFRDGSVECIAAAVANASAAIFTAPSCLQELERALAYPLRKKTLDAAVQAACLAQSRALARMLECDAGGTTAAASSLPQSRDPHDQKFLELARDCRADFLVTRDKALLELARHYGKSLAFRIVTPRQLAASLAGTT
jgi:putative PIN family toxin of toxin-antitoxin system